MFCSNKLKTTLVISVLAIFVSCKPSLYIPSENLASQNVSFEQLIEGRKVYVNKCNGCHSLILPEKYTKDEWVDWVEKMETKSKINANEKNLILQYLTKGSL